ncbi:hypothetical protein CO172_01340 [Candidatus Uhrbacteria bacterium CG_4_9_14_3_um_filter_36_7]|uniref:Uncharacterized protein n=1 Tax=Candidatus Uhrbacteria bacterium CG_4_9_14_3_um_filter_36_7 TaxID=1975033 RepID=A0A2M7XHY4_9BACT|nr:MAG: hypothetical protein CO172_01340 [Candidatus Uhrbacteria bacterium CG_4_9_14_3_um_filter_36_7]
MKNIIIRGPLGVGKSTIAKAVAEKIGGIYISVDEILDQNGLDKVVEGAGIPLSNFLKANEIIWKEAKHAHNDGKSVVVDGNFYHREQIDQLVHFLGKDVIVFTLKASVEVCIARDAARSKPYGEDATRAVHMFVSAFDYGTIIDTEAQTPQETLWLIMTNVIKQNVILTSSFNNVAQELREKALLPKTASVSFIPTAGDPYLERPWIDADRKALIELGYSVTDVDLKGVTAHSLEKELSRHDIIFVAGGNTTYLVEQAHLTGFPSVVRKLLKEGKMYIGSSAGSIFAGPTVEPFVTEDLAELSKDFVLTDQSCLNLVDYIVLPHDQVEQFSVVHDKILNQYGEKFTFLRLIDKEYRTENITIMDNKIAQSSGLSKYPMLLLVISIVLSIIAIVLSVFSFVKSASQLIDQSSFESVVYENDNVKCSDTVPCNGDFVCDNSKCVAPPAECTKDDDCGVEKYCYKGSCFIRLAETKELRSTRYSS